MLTYMYLYLGIGIALPVCVHFNHCVSLSVRLSVPTPDRPLLATLNFHTKGANKVKMRYILLRHDSRNKVKHTSHVAGIFSVPSLGIDPGSPRCKTNALTTEPKSRLSYAVVRD